MMNLSQKIQSARMENVKMSALKEISKQENLFRNVENNQNTFVTGRQLERHHLDSITIRYEGFGLEVRDDSQDDKLMAGDRVIEVNGEDVLRIMPGAWASLPGMQGSGNNANTQRGGDTFQQARNLELAPAFRKRKQTA